MSSISPTNSAAAEIAENYRAKEEEKERISAENEREIATLKKSYEVEKATLADRFEKAIATDKQKFYENVRNQKRDLKRAEDSLSQMKEQVVDQKQNELGREQSLAETDGKKKVDETKKRYAAALAYEEKTGQENHALAKRHYTNSAQTIIDENEAKIGDLYSQKEQEHQSTAARTKEAIDQMHRGYQSQQDNTQSAYAQQVRSDQNKVQADLNQRRVQNAQVMSAYSTRQADPFYQMVKTDAEITENRDAYTLRIRVPEHEKDTIKVQVQGQELLITGTRTNNEKAEIAPGNWITTSNYQNYTEKYPLAVPVDSKSVMMREEGDELVYEVLKFGPNHRQHAAEQQAEKDKRINTVTTVDFPKSLPQASVRPKGPKGTIA